MGRRVWPLELLRLKMSTPGPKELRLAFLTQKRKRMLRLTQNLFDDFGIQ